MENNQAKTKRLSAIPGVLNWARQNFPRTDDTERALRALAEADIQISLGPIYAICRKLAHREITYEAALEKVEAYKGKFYRDAGLEIIPLFNDYITAYQDQGIDDLKHTRARFPLGKNSEGKVMYVPVKPTYITIREGRLHPVFVLGWVNSPLTYDQRRLISAVIKRALLTQQDFLDSDAEIVTFPRRKGGKVRYQGGWKISAFQDLTESELAKQVDIYNNALKAVLQSLMPE